MHNKLKGGIFQFSVKYLSLKMSSRKIDIPKNSRIR